ncbi:MAG: outer membrane beta-barrel protein [Gallionellaceae bacterium]|nr:outer membrane beta-barrel protein [Gallionellaceae bacterium]
MMKKLLAATMLTACAMPALAADDSGVYLVGTIGSVTKITDVETTSSATGMIGYRFSRFFAIEGGMGALASDAKYAVLPAPVTVAGTTYQFTKTTLAGSEFAAVFGLPLSKNFSLYLKGGFTNLEREYSPSPNEYEDAWSGSLVGVGAQYMLPFSIKAGGGKIKIGFRLGANRYNLKNSTGTSTMNPVNAYAGGVIAF